LAEHTFRLLQARHIAIDEAKVVADLEALVPQYVSHLASVLMATISHGFLVMIFVVFLLFGRDAFKRRTGIAADIERTFRKYLIDMTMVSSATSVLVGISLWMMGMPMAWLFAFLVFLFSYIPSIGAIVATLFPVPIAFAQYSNPWMIVAVVAVPAVIHGVIGNIVAPRLMAHGLELHPVTVLLALAFWGLLWGIVGMVLAVPMVAMLRIVLQEFGTTRPIANLLAGRIPARSLPATPST
jgi:AI-2 transport protein TqsA